MINGMTPRFTIRVWGSCGRDIDEYERGLDALTWPECGAAPTPRRYSRMPVAEIEVDRTSEDGDFSLTIDGHRGLDLIPQKMLTASPMG